MISKPYEHQHPIFQGQKEYALERAVFDTGDASNEAAAVLTFRHGESGRVRVFRFAGIGFTQACGNVMGLRGYLPVYVASLEGRGLEHNIRIEVGDTDPGNVWFWAEAVEEVS